MRRQEKEEGIQCEEQVGQPPGKVELFPEPQLGGVKGGAEGP